MKKNFGDCWIEISYRQTTLPDTIQTMSRQWKKKNFTEIPIYLVRLREML